MRVFVFIAFFLTQLTWAVELPPKMLRACIDYDNDIVTIKWSPPKDGCGSFEKYLVFGSENLGPFKKLTEITNLGISEYPHALLVQNTSWRYYITTYYLCGGVDSLRSDTLEIDITYPINIEIDSISYDLETQHIVAGWKKNPSRDTKHYEIFDYRSGSGDLLGQTEELIFDVTEKRSGRFPIVLATIDSCNLSSLLSQPHEVVFLKGSIDSCSKKISLSWNLYVGWGDLDSQSVFLSKNDETYIKYTTLSSTAKSSNVKDFELGDTIKLFVRSYKGEKSSTSNTITFYTRKLVKPEKLTLNVVDVENNILVISWLCEKQKDTREFNIYVGQNRQVFKKLSTTPVNLVKNSYQIQDLENKPNTRSYFYYIESVDKCGDQSMTTDTSVSIHLDTNKTNIHNEYLGWQNGVLSYSIETQNGSTWNEVLKKPNVFVKQETNDLTECYRIAATENTNNPFVAHSNTVCRKKKLRYYVTTGLNIGGVNRRFIIKGQGINRNESRFKIYNRWGEMIKSGTLNESWDGSYKGKSVDPGIYLYVAKIYGENGEYEQTKGTISVVN